MALRPDPSFKRTRFRRSVSVKRWYGFRCQRCRVNQRWMPKPHGPASLTNTNVLPLATSVRTVRATAIRSPPARPNERTSSSSAAIAQSIDSLKYIWNF
jgi:hypothetical protein